MWVLYDTIFHSRELPIWTNKFYFGAPVTLYYGPLSHLPGALLTALFHGNLTWAAMLLQILIGAWTCFLLWSTARMLTDSDACGAAAAVLFAFSTQRYASQIEYGAYPVLPIWLLVSVVCRVWLGNSSRRSFLLGLTGGLGMLVHSQYGLILCALLAVLWVCDSRERSLRQSIMEGGIQASAAFATSAWFLVPLFIERDWTLLATEKSALFFQEGFPILEAITGGDSWVVQPLGPFLLALLAASVAGWRKDRARPIASMLIGTGTLLAGSFVVPRCYQVAFPLILLVASSGLKFIADATVSASPKVRFLIVLLPIASAWWAHYSHWLIPLHTKAVTIPRFASAPQGNATAWYRILAERHDKAPFWRGMDAANPHFATPFGPVPQLACRVFPYVAVMAYIVHRDLRGEDLSDDSKDALALMNVSAIWRRNGMETVPDASPAWFAPQLSDPIAPISTLRNTGWYQLQQAWSSRSLDASELQEQLRVMRMQRQARRLATIPMAAPLDHAAPGDTGKLEGAPLEVIEFRESHSTVELTIRAPGDGWVQVATAWFPTHRVLVDGAPASCLQSEMGFSVVPVREGDNRIQLRAGVSRTRYYLFVGTIVLWLAIIPSLVWSRVFRRSPGPERGRAASPGG